MQQVPGFLGHAFKRVRDERIGSIRSELTSISMEERNENKPFGLHFISINDHELTKPLAG